MHEARILSDSQVGRRRHGAACLLFALALGCSNGGETPADAGLRGAIFILLDTVRADHVSTAGYPRQTTPSLEALAKRGVVFEQAISYSSWTLPSVVAILSGSGASRPAVFAFGGLGRSLVESIREAGFATAAFTEGGFVSRELGFDRGFATYVEEEGKVQRLLPGESRHATRPGSIDRTFSQAGAWLSDNATRPFFLFVHTYEPHTPYRRHAFTEGLASGAVGEAFGTEKLPKLRNGSLRFDDADLRYVKALYDGGIRESDRHVGRLMKLLEELEIADTTLVVVSSDHGEELGERDPASVGDHGRTLYDDLLRVPLIIANPAEAPAVSRVREQVRTIDILPTIAELLGVALPVAEPTPAANPNEAPRPDYDGRSLVPFLRGQESSGRIAFGGSPRELPARSFVRHLGYKYIETKAGSPNNPKLPSPPPRQLYDLDDDPGEQHNLVEREPQLAARYARWLSEHLALQQQSAINPALESVPEALRERLRSLGYLE